MSIKSRSVTRFRLSRKKFQLLVTSFLADTTSLQAAKITHVHRHTAERYFRFFRALVLTAAHRERRDHHVGNGIEADESYFGPKRQRGKRGRGAANKVVVFGLLERAGRVYTQIIPDASKEALLPIIRRTVRSGSDIYTDGWRSYDALAIYGYNHKKVKHDDNEFSTKDEAHINGIESFWSFCKRRLTKFNGIPKREFPTYLLESEWRSNHRDDMERQLRLFIRRYRRNSYLS